MSIDALLAGLPAKIAYLETEMSRPEVASDHEKIKVLAREHRRARELVDLDGEIRRLRREISEMQAVRDDPELGELAQAELPQLGERLAHLERKLKTLLAPEDPADSRNVVLEIRAGTGGEEAALFGANLYKMYTRYIERSGWKHQLINGHFSDLGGVREVTLGITGDGAYGRLKLESGVHRVQRVPVTEASGRIHTSAATVAVLPEAEEIDVEIAPEDIKTDTYRASGAGGQHINKTESAVRITHLPTGLVVTCQDERSQLKNKMQAMKVLRSKLFQMKLEAEAAKRSAQRRQQVSTGDRSAKIRTYNFPQNRVTDHRVPITIYNLEAILEGGLDQLLEPLAEYFAAERLAELAGGGD
jgi:peptide chain release factor 1